MKRAILFSAILFICCGQATARQVVAGRTGEVFKRQNLATGLNNPWEITYGPDGFLWITESRGYRVYRMNTVTGVRTTVLDISQNSEFLPVGERGFNLQFNFSGQGNPQGGLAGLAIHPDFNDLVSPKRYVYVSYIHKFVANNAPSGKIFTNNIVRFTYNTGTGRLESPVSLCDTLPGSNDHNSQRMIIAPEGGNYYLFYAAGDMGSGQFDNHSRPQYAQDPQRYEGKILRFNLEEDADATSAFDRWIPNDNPFNTTSPARQSAVWSTGIRNNQGFAYHSINGKLYGSSHGPYSDDEINIIEREKNYGHPLVIGYSTDGNYDGLRAGANGGSCPLITSESANAAAIGVNYRDPVFSAYARQQSEISAIFYGSINNSQWPSEGWSGLDVYTQNYIPGWKNSLISAGLKWGRLIRNKLNHDGTGILQIGGADTASYFQSTNRFRDLAISPDGKDLFVIMDQSSATSGPTTGSTLVPACPGCVQKYTFLGYNSDALTQKSNIPAEVDVSAGTPGTCVPGTEVVINADNNNLWVPITGPDGNIVAEIHANGNNLGTVSASFYVNNSAVREAPDKRLYADRNITLSVQNPVPQGSSVKLRFYITEAELEAIKNATTSQGISSGVAGISSLKIRKNNNNCTAVYTPDGDSIISPLYAEAHGTGGFVLQGETKSFSTFYFTNPEAAVLPLRLLSFTGRLEGSAGLLQWATEQESNTASFIVERSSDGQLFTPLGTVPASGNSTYREDYFFADNNLVFVTSPVAYYRLKMVDADGRFAYSGTIQLRLADMAGRVEAFPNPATAQLHLSMNAAAAGKVQWRMYDNTGRVVMQGIQPVQKGKTIASLQVAHLQAGVYYIDVTGSGIQQRVRFQKL